MATFSIVSPSLAALWNSISVHVRSLISDSRPVRPLVAVRRAWRLPKHQRSVAAPEPRHRQPGPLQNEDFSDSLKQCSSHDRGCVWRFDLFSTSNVQHARPMPNAQYNAPWFSVSVARTVVFFPTNCASIDYLPAALSLWLWYHQRPGDNYRHLPHNLFKKLSSRGRKLARRVVLPPGVRPTLCLQWSQPFCHAHGSTATTIA